MKYSEKEKDWVLAAFCEESPINFDRDIVSILSADGYVETLASPNGRVTGQQIRVRRSILPEGIREQRKRNAQKSSATPCVP